jgi:hypothetical protein
MRDVINPAARQPVNYGHRLKVRQRKAEFVLEPGVNRIPELDLEPDYVVEQAPQVCHRTHLPIAGKLISLRR